VANQLWRVLPPCCCCVQVFVERSVQQSECPDLEVFDPAVTQVDFAITLGGDGTVL
jgi:NAD kinase